MGREQQVPTSTWGPAQAAVLTARREEAGWRVEGGGRGAKVPAPGTERKKSPSSGRLRFISSRSQVCNAEVPGL